MSDLLDRLNQSIIDCETDEPLDDDARPDLYASDVREVIGEMVGLIDKLRPQTHRLCLTCGKWWNAEKHPWGSQPCANLSANPHDMHPCTLDRTLEESMLYWRDLAHVYYERSRRAEDREREWTRGPEPSPWPYAASTEGEG